MPPKMSRRATCCFCGASTDESPDYVEVEVTRPAAPGGQRQLFGANATCMSAAMAGVTQVEIDLLEG